MAVATVHSRAQIGVEAPPVTVEVDIANGIPNLRIVGLPETAVKESKDRVRAALKNTSLDFLDRRITVSLAPADLPKEGGRFDLPIALGILVASGLLKQDQLDQYEFVGELSLGGLLRPVRGVLPAVLQAKACGRRAIVPTENGPEAILAANAEVLCASSLLQVVAFLDGKQMLKAPTNKSEPTTTRYPDLSSVYGQEHARRALELAAAGSHNLLMCGPPGCGKTLLASCLPGILPPMNDGEALETAIIASLGSQSLDVSKWKQRRFRSPHHTVSGIALAGGGSKPRPGEISLAHNGVLFLDELPEFDRRSLEVLREPMESGQIVISRAIHRATFPAKFQLIAAMNPCPCGYAGDESGRCRCPAERIDKYRSRISGPLLDRIDLHINIPRISIGILYRQDSLPEASANVRSRVMFTRKRQLDRAGVVNARMDHDQISTFCALQPECRNMLEKADEKLKLSARAHNGILKVARTIADLNGSDQIEVVHLGEALAYRPSLLMV